MQKTEQYLIDTIKRNTNIKQIDKLIMLGGGKANHSYQINSNIFLQINNNISRQQQTYIEKICNSGFKYFAKNIDHFQRFYHTEIGTLQIMENKNGKILTKEKLDDNMIKSCFRSISETTNYLQKFYTPNNQIHLYHKNNNLLIHNLKEIKNIDENGFFLIQESKHIPELDGFTKGLVHGDTNYRNILEHKNTIVGIIDYEAIHTNIVLFDLADFIRSILKFGLVNNTLIKQAITKYKEYNTINNFEENNFIYLIKYLIINTGLRYYLSFQNNSLPYFSILTQEEKKKLIPEMHRRNKTDK